MYAKCIDCKLEWNISIKTKIPKEGYKCPKCRSKERSAQQKPVKFINRRERIPNVLLKNRSKFQA
jgi:DNA-directed RNA polymerase subunit RPC12/RpoP